MLLFEDLAIEDNKLKMMDRFDILVEVALAIRAKEKLQQQEAATMPPPSPSLRFTTRPKKRKSTAGFSHDLQVEPKEKKCKAVENRGNGPQPSPPLPEELKNAIQEVARGRNVTPAALVIQKKLYKTDVSGGHNRLSIPVNQIRNNFLIHEEKRYLGKKKAMEVKIIEPSLELNDVKFSKWDMNTTSNYVIIGNWSDIVRKNGLEKGTEVQLWSFRVDHLLYFALVRLESA